jgi:hypothetical protein
MDTVAQNAPRRENVLSESLALIRTNKRAFLVSNLIYYAVLIVGLVIVTFNRELQQTLYDAVGQTFGEGGPLAAIGEAYGTEQTFRAVALTFVVNLVIGTFFSITLPSLIVPFSGWLVALYRALLWGFIFSPVPGTEPTGQNLLAGLLIVALLLLEGEGYILGAFAAWLQGRAVVFHKRQGYDSLGRGYVAGLKQTILLYVPIIIVLLVAAIYEVIIAHVIV